MDPALAAWAAGNGGLQAPVSLEAWAAAGENSDEEPSEPLGDSVLAVRDNDEGQLVVHGGVDAKAKLVVAQLREALALVPVVGTHHAPPFTKHGG